MRLENFPADLCLSLVTKLQLLCTVEVTNYLVHYVCMRLYVTNLIKLIRRVRDPMSMEMTLITSTVDIGDCADFRSAIKELKVEEWWIKRFWTAPAEFHVLNLICKFASEIGGVISIIKFIMGTYSCALWCIRMTRSTVWFCHGKVLWEFQGK